MLKWAYLIKVKKYILFCNKVPIDRNLSTITITVRFDSINACRLVLVIVFCRRLATRKAHSQCTHIHIKHPLVIVGSLDLQRMKMIFSGIASLIKSFLIVVDFS